MRLRIELVSHAESRENLTGLNLARRRSIPAQPFLAIPSAAVEANGILAGRPCQGAPLAEADEDVEIAKSDEGSGR